MSDERQKKPRQPRPPNDPHVRHKMYSFRLYPTVKQVGTLEWTLRRCKELYNAALEERKAAYQMYGVSISYAMQANQLPDIKALREEYCGVHSQVLQDVLKRLDKAMDAFFRRVAQGQTPGYPRFKSGNRVHSFTYPQGGYEILGAPDHLQQNQKQTCRLVLSKIGHIKMIMHRSIKGKIKTCTIKREGDHWYALLCVEETFDPTMAFHPSTDEVGIDVGIKSYAVLSNGQQIENPRFYRRSEPQIKRAHKKLHRRKQGSRRRDRAKKELSRLYRQTRHRRADFLHKEARHLVNQ
jgi:putative transposase